jgi:hypothetical protein
MNTISTTITSEEFYLPLVFLSNKAIKIIDGEGDYKSALTGFVIICLAIYILAIVFSKKSSCIIINGWSDFALLASPLVITTFIVLYNIFYGYDNEEIIEANNIAANIIFLIPIIITFAISIISNIRNSNIPWSVFFIIISIAGKIVVMIVMAVFIILCIGILGGYQKTKGEKDGRYKSGYRPGKNNFWYVAAAIAVLGFLATVFVKSIVKIPNEYNKADDE